MTGIEIDFETRSDIELKTCGMFRYFESPHARVLIGSYSIDGGPIRRRQYGEPCPADLVEALEAGAIISAHNAGFETQCFLWLHEHCGWPMPRFEQFRCTAATAAALSLPRALDTKGGKTGLAEALGLGDDKRKDKEGERLIQLFSKPRRHRKGDDPTKVYFNEPEDFPADFERFKAYCDQDVVVEAAADNRMIPLPDSEQAVWLLTEKINRRGVRIDVRSARAALRLADKAKKVLDHEIKEATGGYVTAASQVSRLVEWVQQQGVVLDSAGKAEIVDLLEKDDIPANVRRALEIRQEAGKTSVSKLKAMLDRANADGRVRGGFVYHQAGTGRTQSVGVNWNNLPRPRRVYEEEKPRTDVLFRAFRSEEPELLSFLYGSDLGRPLHLVSDAIRGFIWAAPGYDLIQADYSNIEGNVLAWLAGEEWKLQAIRELIADPSLPDMYRRTAAHILGLTTDVVTKKHWARQAVGKPAELGLGYGGGVMAFVTFARGYGVKLDGIAAQILEQADGERLEKATKRYEGQVKLLKSGTDVLARDTWIACEVVKLGWRAQNAAIAKSWHAAEGAVRDAVYSPGVITDAARCSFLSKHGFLFARLPSGRCLAYAAPKLKAQVWARIRLGPDEWSDAEVMDRDSAERGERLGDIKIEGSTSDKVTFLGVNSTTKRWERSALYSGLIVENLTQATARDLLVNGMFRAEAAGYPIIATVYDEIISEVPRGYGSVEEFEREICVLPEWAKGLPLTAGGWRGKRYRKE